MSALGVNRPGPPVYLCTLEGGVYLLGGVPSKGSVPSLGRVVYLSGVYLLGERVYAFQV